ncbi:hypothetical protein Tco_1001472 [Tanacetum coccineum]
MLTGKWTPMNANVQKFNQLVGETLVHSGENNNDWMTRVKILFKTHTGVDFKHKSAWLFLKDKHKWKNLESTLARRHRLRVVDEEPEHFGEDALPRPPGLQQISKSQRSSNSTASSDSNPLMYQEMMKEQYELDRKAKMEVIERETNERMRLYHSQRIAEDMKVLQIDTRGMDTVDAAIINAQKDQVRLAAPSRVTKDITKLGDYGGFPAVRLTATVSCVTKDITKPCDYGGFPADYPSGRVEMLDMFDTVKSKIQGMEGIPASKEWLKGSYYISRAIVPC